MGAEDRSAWRPKRAGAGPGTGATGSGSKGGVRAGDCRGIDLYWSLPPFARDPTYATFAPIADTDG
jgi:hypothetical protein